jgi:Protein of unknown function (DUF4231)
LSSITPVDLNCPLLRLISQEPVMSERSVPTYVSAAIHYYDKSAKMNRAGFLLIKFCQLTISASLPITSLIRYPPIAQHQNLLTGAMGAALLVLEGVQQTCQFQPRWTKFRATYNMLQRELNLYENDAGPYSSAANDRDGPLLRRLFTERADGILASENSDWMALQEKSMGQTAKA